MAAPVLNCEVGSGPDPTKGAASFALAHRAPGHIAFAAQSLSVVHVSEAAAVDSAKLDRIFVSIALGLGALVSKTTKEKSEAKLVGSGVGEESVLE